MPEAKKKAGIQRPAKRHAKRRAFIVPLRPAKHTKVKKEINRTPQKALETRGITVEPNGSSFLPEHSSVHIVPQVSDELQRIWTPYQNGNLSGSGRSGFWKYMDDGTFWDGDILQVKETNFTWSKMPAQQAQRVRKITVGTLLIEGVICINPTQMSGESAVTATMVRNDLPSVAIDCINLKSEIHARCAPDSTHTGLDDVFKWIILDAVAADLHVRETGKWESATDISLEFVYVDGLISVE